jgi:ABC-type phosphate transport system substrate-binding protein
MSSNTVTTDNDYYTIPIGHARVPTNYISPQDLWAIFTLASTKWENGQKITVILYPSDNTILKTFVKEYFGVNSFRFHEIINGRVNTGRAIPPTIVETEAEMISEVRRTQGSIGFTKQYVVMRNQYGIKQIKTR